ncbi:DNA repair protein RAD50 [Diplonema papillatum]|nr:DNA repair protein RAD50 [Diplonema papillatum]KAJ9441826.1 DNA repair protein RAD50 [Diplonema papillatum]
MQRQVAEVDRELAVNRQQIEQHQGREAELKRLIASKEALYAELTREYDKDIPDLLKKAEAKEEKDRKAVATMQALQMCHDNFTSQADDEGCCPICARSMGDAELAVMQNNMAQKLRDVPAIVAKKEEALGKTQNLVRKVRALLPTHAEVARLREEHPKVSAHISTLSDRVEVQKVSLSDHTAQLDALRFEEKAFRELVSAVDKIRDLQDTMKSVENSIAAEESKIAAQHGAGVRPLDIVQKDIENKQQEMNNIVSAQQQAMKHAEEIRAEQSQLLDQIQRQRRLADEKQMQINERQRVRLQYDTSLEEYKKGTTESADLKQKRPQLEEQLLKLENEVKAQRAIGDSKEAQLSNEVEKQQQASSRMMALTSEVKRFIGENKSDILDATVSKLAGLESVQRERLQQIEVLEQKHTEYKTKIFQQDVTRRELEANVQYREKCRQVEKTQHELARFRHIIKEKSRGHEGVWKSLDHLRDEKAGMDRDRATIAGQMQATENLLRERQKELQSAKYDRIDERYNSTLIRLATMQMTEDDLQKYYGALDCALMKYHDEKITEINEVIRDLWIRTYRGQDIDYIELRSDIEAGASTGGASNRNYNYRVVMIKQGVALDMRGRCSAGQRVLASLVVRLALSQAFCCDCGILALDEPTTNLDVENIDSLAYALTEIISSRRGQSNFQLIIITHDEQFVRRIGHACGTEVVFHISRDPEGRFSVITEREFAEMM